MPPPLSARTMARIAEGAKQFLPNPTTGNEPFVVPRYVMATPKQRAQAALRALNALDSQSWPAAEEKTPQYEANKRARVALTELIQWLGYDTRAQDHAGGKPWGLVVDKPIATDPAHDDLVWTEFKTYAEGAGLTHTYVQFEEGRWLASALDSDGRSHWFDVRDAYVAYKDHPPTHTVSFHPCD